MRSVVVVLGSLFTIAPAWGQAADAVADAQEVAAPRWQPSGPAVDVRKRIVPSYPSPLKALHGDAVIECTAVIDVDSKGSASRVSVVECPDGFHLAAVGALSRWRFTIPVQAGQRVTARTVVTTGFGGEAGRFTPGYSYFTHPEELTSDPEASLLIRSGSMPRYPEAVMGGHASCVIDLVVTKGGGSKSLAVDGCATPYRKAAQAAVSGWKWYPAHEDGRAVEREVRFSIDFMK